MRSFITNDPLSGSIAKALSDIDIEMRRILRVQFKEFLYYLEDHEQQQTHAVGLYYGVTKTIVSPSAVSLNHASSRTQSS